MKGMPVKQAMNKVGYSKATQVDRVTKSKSWEKLLGQISDEKLIKRHNAGLDAVDNIGNPDHNTRFRFLHEAYELKGRLHHEPTQPPGTTINVLTINQIQQIAREVLGTSPTGIEGEFNSISDSNKSKILSELAPQDSSERIGEN